MINEACKILKKHNLRVTFQRKAILKILYNCRGHHLDIENIYQLLCKTNGGKNKAGIATVYRTMEMFEKIGLVLKLYLENLPARYELVLPDDKKHHHLICLKCGIVQELNDCFIKEFKHVILKEKGFTVKDKSIKIYGYCSKCIKKV